MSNVRLPCSSPPPLTSLVLSYPCVSTSLLLWPGDCSVELTKGSLALASFCNKSFRKASLGRGYSSHAPTMWKALPNPQNKNKLAKKKKKRIKSKIKKPTKFLLGDSFLYVPTGTYCHILWLLQPCRIYMITPIMRPPISRLLHRWDLNPLWRKSLSAHPRGPLMFEILEMIQIDTVQLRSGDSSGGCSPVWGLYLLHWRKYPSPVAHFPSRHMGPSSKGHLPAVS